MRSSVKPPWKRGGFFVPTYMGILFFKKVLNLGHEKPHLPKANEDTLKGESE